MISNRLRLLARKYHPYGDIGDNCFISYVDDTLQRPTHQFARIRFLGLLRGSSQHNPVQVIICQRAALDAEATDAHGLRARRLRLQTFGHFQLPARCFESLQLAPLIHDCPESAARGTPCSFVNDVPFTSFQSGRKRFLNHMFQSDLHCCRQHLGRGVRHSPDSVWIESPIAMSQDQV